MTLIDTSAWVEYLRATGSATHHQVVSLIASDRAIHTTDAVVMELLAGGRDEAHTDQLRRMLSGCTFIPTAGLADFEEAAALYRQCRQSGERIRVLTDCLIAAVAIRAKVAVLHSDRDFNALARHTALQVVAAPTA